MILINLFAGPGAGKSTTAAGVFSALKQRDISVELVTEYAKDLTWDESFGVLKDQVLVFAEQRHRLLRLAGKVKYVVTDSPMLTSVLYAGDELRYFSGLVWEAQAAWPSMNYVLHRVKRYEQAGRTQTEQEAIEIDKKVEHMLQGIGYTGVPGGTQQAIDRIVDDVLDREAVNDA